MKLMMGCEYRRLVTFGNFSASRGRRSARRVTARLLVDADDLKEPRPAKQAKSYITSHFFCG
jgi:hypothetical protein